MNENSQTRLRLSVVIIGAGIAGLAAAIVLAQRGHTGVNVLERRNYDAASSASVSGIYLVPNAVQLLRTWGVVGFFEKSSVCKQVKVRRYATRGAGGGGIDQGEQKARGDGGDLVYQPSGVLEGYI